MARIGIMSVAHMHAFSYAACINENPDAELVAIWDDDVKRGKKAAKACDTSFVRDMNKFLSSGIEAVIVCSENINHRWMVEAAAKAGLWILCEKPLATTVADAKAMIKACDKAGVGLGTAFPCRYAPGAVAMREMIQAGRCGELYAATCTNNGTYPGGWFSDEAQSGGGATMDHTVHVADLLRWMTGREFTKVYCENGTFFKKDIKTDDMGMLHLEMEGGLKVSHTASWCRSATFPTWGDVTIQLVTENGVIDLDAFVQKIDIYSDDAPSAEWVPWGTNPDMGLISDFIDAVDNRRAPSVTGIDGLRALEVTTAAHKSVKSGRPVKV